MKKKIDTPNRNDVLADEALKAANKRWPQPEGVDPAIGIMIMPLTLYIVEAKNYATGETLEARGSTQQKALERLITKLTRRKIFRALVPRKKKRIDP